ncbi:MAG: VCBS repeat-containing protein [Gemmatimonadales bacterium]|nr:VCBS repeat-containing protein [Gemmatimonadales bacterium]
MKFNQILPYFEVVDLVDLEEDPGSLAFLGSPGGERDELAVSLPGVDQVVFVRMMDGEWSISQALAAGDQPFSLVAMDLDGDQEMELLCANHGPLSNSLGRYDRQIDDTYILTRTISLDCSPDKALKYDWDQDGIEEVMVADEESSQILALSIGESLATEVGRMDFHLTPDQMLIAGLPGSATGFFASGRERPIIEYYSLQEGGLQHEGANYPGCPSRGLLQCDFNGDGIGDLVCLGGEAEVISVMYGKQNLDYWGYDAVSLNSDPWNSALADFNGDGELDLVVTELISVRLDLFSGLSGGGLFVEPESQTLDFFPLNVVAIQLDEESDLELASQDLFTGDIHLMEYSSTVGFETLSQFAMGTSTNQILATDVDNDGWDDLLGYSTGSGDVSVFFGQGGGSFSDRVDWSITSGLVEAIPLDLNADGFLDLVVSQSGIWSALNIGGRALDDAQFVSTSVSTLATGDLDGDGDQDVVGSNNEEGILAFFENDGNGTLVRRSDDLILPFLPEDLFCADLNHDGRDEIVVNLREAGTVGIVFPYGVWQFSPVFQFPSFGDAEKIFYEDINSDGSIDFLVLDGSERVGYIMPNSEMVLVAVDPSSLEVECGAEAAEIRIQPNRPGSWTLELDSSLGRMELAADGRAVRGALEFEQGVWSLSLGREDFTDVGEFEFGSLRLTMGEAGAHETLTVGLPLNCLYASGPGLFPDLQWLQQPWPNPCNPIMQASFTLGLDGPVEVGVYDLAGRLVKVLVREERLAGEHTVAWKGDTEVGAAPAGVYLLSIRTTNAHLTRKVLLLK